MSEKQTVFQKWMHLSMKAAWLFLLVLLHVTYFTLFIPVALLFKWLSDPLRLRVSDMASGGSFFVARKCVTETRETASRPY